MPVDPEDAFARQPLVALVRIGHEVAARGRRLRAESLCVHIPTREGRLIFTWENGSTWVTAAGFEVELSALPEWERWRPGGT